MKINDLKNSDIIRAMSDYEKVFWLNPDCEAEPSCPYGKGH